MDGERREIGRSRKVKKEKKKKRKGWLQRNRLLEYIY